MDKEKTPEIAEKPYTVGILIANLKLRERNKAEAERLHINVEDLMDRDEFAEADAAKAHRLSESVVLSEIADYERTDVRRVQVLCEAESGIFDMTTMKQLAARVAILNNIDIHEIYKWTLDHFADAADKFKSDKDRPDNDAQGKSKAKKEAQNIFKKENDTWTIRFNGSEIQRGIKDCKAAGDIAYLLRNQGKHMDIYDLPNNCMREQNERDAPVDIPDSPQHSTPTQSTPMATKGDHIALLQQITELQNDPLGKTDELVHKENEKKIAALRKQQNQNFDKNGEPRELTGDIQKMIESTQKRVHERFITMKLADLLPELATHLSLHLQTSHMCFYSPESEIIWDLGPEK